MSDANNDMFEEKPSVMMTGGADHTDDATCQLRRLIDSLREDARSHRLQAKSDAIMADDFELLLDSLPRKLDPRAAGALGRLLEAARAQGLG